MIHDKEEKLKKALDEELIPPSSPIFASSTRLTIMLILFAHKKAGFTDLQKFLKITPGKLGHHIKKLETEKYVKTQRTFFSTRPLTVIKITQHGENSFRDYIYKLRDILNKIP